MDFLDFVKQAIENNSEVKYDSLNSRLSIGDEALYYLNDVEDNTVKRVVDIRERAETDYILYPIQATDAAYRIMKVVRKKLKAEFTVTAYKVEVAGEHVKFYFEEITEREKAFEQKLYIKFDKLKLRIWLATPFVIGLGTFLYMISGLL